MRIIASPRWWRYSLAGAAGYRPLFALMVVISLACTFIIATAPDANRETHSDTRSRALNKQETSVAVADPADERLIRREENKNMAKYVERLLRRLVRWKSMGAYCVRAQLVE